MMLSVRKRRASVILAISTVCLASGCSTDTSTGGSANSNNGLTPVKLQLQWTYQAQFAGYQAAVDQGFYEDVGLDVELVEGAPDIVPQNQLADGLVDYALAWVPKALASREQGADITHVAQVFQRSALRHISFIDLGIDDPSELAGHTVGTSGAGNEFEIFAGLTSAGLDPREDVTIVQQGGDMNAFLSGDVDTTSVTTYNELGQVLASVDGESGELYQLDDLNMIDWNETGDAMLHDAIWADTERLAEDEEYREMTVDFLKASARGWLFARDEPGATIDMVLAANDQLGESSQTWQLNEVNKLIWPSTAGFGILDEEAWNRTVDIASSTRNLEGSTVITREPEDDARTAEYMEQALEELRSEDADIDLVGDSFTPMQVTLLEGGR